MFNATDTATVTVIGRPLLPWNSIRSFSCTIEECRDGVWGCGICTMRAPLSGGWNGSNMCEAFDYNSGGNLFYDSKRARSGRGFGRGDTVGVYVDFGAAVPFMAVYVNNELQCTIGWPRQWYPLRGAVRLLGAHPPGAATPRVPPARLRRVTS